MVSTLNAIRGTDLRRPQSAVDERFRQLDEHERRARTALAHLGAGTPRRFVALE